MAAIQSTYRERYILMLRQPSRSRQAIVPVIPLRSELILLRENEIQGNDAGASVCPNLPGRFVKQDER